MHQQIVLSSRLGSILPVSLYISLSSYYCNYDDCLTIKKDAIAARDVCNVTALSPFHIIQN